MNNQTHKITTIKLTNPDHPNNPINLEIFAGEPLENCLNRLRTHPHTSFLVQDYLPYSDSLKKRGPDEELIYYNPGVPLIKDSEALPAFKALYNRVQYPYTLSIEAQKSAQKIKWHCPLKMRWFESQRSPIYLETLVFPGQKWSAIKQQIFWAQVIQCAKRKNSCSKQRYPKKSADYKAITNLKSNIESNYEDMMNITSSQDFLALPWNIKIGTGDLDLSDMVCVFSPSFELADYLPDVRLKLKKGELEKVENYPPLEWFVKYEIVHDDPNVQQKIELTRVELLFKKYIEGGSWFTFFGKTFLHSRHHIKAVQEALNKSCNDINEKVFFLLSSLNDQKLNNTGKMFELLTKTQKLSGINEETINLINIKLNSDSNSKASTKPSTKF